MARIGEIIDGKYEILREVGRGGMSVVYLAMDNRLNKQWAIKEIKRQGSNESNQIVMQSLLAEANLMKKLDHPILPRIVDILETAKTIYVVMDYIEGEALDKVLKAYGAQPEAAVVEWGKQLCDVLDYLHTRTPPIIYRDMKPGNIMLKPDGSIKLFDFGIAREFKEGNNEDTVCLGTKGYAAPEQYGGKGQTDARTDIYCLGVTLYHLVTGKNPCEPPYEIYPIRHWDPALSSGLEWVIQKCTQLNPADRFQSCAELRYVLDNLERFDSAYRARQRRKIRWFTATCIATVICLALGVGSMVLQKQAERQNYQYLVENGNYLEAIDLDDKNPEAYLGYLEDNQSKPMDEETLAALNMYYTTTNLNYLKNNYPEMYVEITYLIGCKYLVVEGDSGLTTDTNRIKSAAGCFERVVDVVNSGEVQLGENSSVILEFAEVYAKVGKLLEMKAASSVMNKGSNTDDDWEQGWSDFTSALDITASKIDRDLLKAGAYSTLAYIIASKAEDFANNGISPQQMRSACDEIREEVNKLASGYGEIVEEVAQLLSTAEEKITLKGGTK